MMRKARRDVTLSTGPSFRLPGRSKLSFPPILLFVSSLSTSYITSNVEESAIQHHSKLPFASSGQIVLKRALRNSINLKNRAFKGNPINQLPSLYMSITPEDDLGLTDTSTAPSSPRPTTPNTFCGYRCLFQG
jgi:hypothetical protein